MRNLKVGGTLPRTLSAGPEYEVVRKINKGALATAYEVKDPGTGESIRSESPAALPPPTPGTAVRIWRLPPLSSLDDSQDRRAGVRCQRGPRLGKSAQVGTEPTLSWTR